MEHELSLSEIYKAHHVLKDVVRKTAIIPAPSIKEDCEIYIKTENLQVTGSFKVRGASYMISQLSDEEKKRGVIACSAGNHAQGVALAAQKHGIPAVICLPEGAPISKVEATRSYGAEICLVPGVYDDAYNRALQLKEERNMTFVHPFNDPMVIAGQGTIGVEIIEDLPNVDVVIVPIGGGGLISGVAYALKQLKPSIKIYGVQALGAPSMVTSLHKGEICRLDSVQTIADGIAVKEPGKNTFDLCKKYVDDVITVTEDEVCAAILFLLEKHKLIAEGAGAVSIAAAMFGNLDLAGKRTVCIVSGGNVDVTALSRIISRGLKKNGRECTISVEILDRPGELVNVATIISNTGANITSVDHRHAASDKNVNACTLSVSMETRDIFHIAEIRQALESADIRIIETSLDK